jgi:hypothetical protein
MDLLDRLVAAFDRRQRRVLGIWEFTADPGCVVRLGLTRALLDADLADGTRVRRGDTVGVIHLWNERMPRIPAGGATLRWAVSLDRALRYSLSLLAAYLQQEPRMQDVQAFGGEFGFVFTPAAIKVLQRLGIEIFEPRPPHGLWNRSVDLAMRIWPYLLRRAFNPESVRGRTLADFGRRPMWLARSTIISRYGAAQTAPQPF